MSANFVWVDLETTGLEVNIDLVVEVGVIVTSQNLVVLDQIEFTMWGQSHEDRYKHIKYLASKPDEPGHESARIVWNMHKDSGLWTQARASLRPPEVVEEVVAEFLADMGVDPKVDPMCGSSVQFDRTFLQRHLPTVEKSFHYRNMDVSSIKGACERLNPTLYSKLDDNSSNRKMHRAIPDCEDTISEFQFYVDNFFFVEGDN